MRLARIQSRGEALAYARQVLEQSGIDAAGAEARILVAGLLGESPEAFFARFSQPLPEGFAPRLRSALRRRARREPLQYILGETEFFGLPLRVRPGVLIPRPETEGLVALARDTLIAMDGAPKVLDVGTGSGAIALALKTLFPDAAVFATDTSAQALAQAKENADRLGLSITFIRAPLTADLKDLDLIVSNPPYLPETFAQSAPPELAFEPAEALFAGRDGLSVARPLARQAFTALRPGGWLVLELDPSNIGALANDLTALGFDRVQILPDLAGRQRYLLGRRPGSAPSEPAGQLELGQP